MSLLRNNYYVLAVLTLYLAGCKHEEGVPEKSYDGYPKEIGDIIVPNCATAGCHNEKSKDAAAGLSLESWNSLLEGGRNNSAVIPYEPEKSLLFIFTNTFENLGPVVKPTMPYGSEPLKIQNVAALYNWIKEGAPNNAGTVPFSNDPQRSKVYVLNSLCDEVAVFDFRTRLIMRYIDAGFSGNEGFPEMIKVAGDNKKWYVLFASGEFIQFDAGNDSKLAMLNLGKGIWRSFSISGDSKTAWVADWSGNSEHGGGNIVQVDLDNMAVISRLNQQEDSIYFPYGITIHPSNGFIFASCYTGNFIYKIDMNNNAKPIVHKVTIDQSAKVEFTGAAYRPRNIAFLPGDTTYAVICERSNELRILHMHTNELLQIISVGKFPQEIVVSKQQPYFFISCMEDKEINGDGKGSVYVIDYRSYSLVKKIYTGYQPKGLALDDTRGYVYVANRNADPTGADAPHHYTDCDGNNGYVTIIDVETLNLVPGFKAEVSVDPFAIELRP